MPDWQQILSQDGPAVWRTAVRLLGNRADADECFQETCLDALAIARREVVKNWRGLLQRLITSRALDRLRTRTRHGRERPLTACEELPAEEPSPFQCAKETELAAELRRALGLLPQSQAEAFCLHCLEDWSYAEIAQHLGISIDSVGVRIHRARTRLRQLLSAYDEGDRSRDPSLDSARSPVD